MPNLQLEVLRLILFRIFELYDDRYKYKMIKWYEKVIKSEDVDIIEEFNIQIEKLKRPPSKDKVILFIGTTKKINMKVATALCSPKFSHY